MPKIHRETTYERWIREEGLPTVRGHGVQDLLSLPLAPWPRLGGRGTFVKLEGMEGVTGMYVCEIPAGAALNPEKHLYEELVYVLQGRGSAEVWAPGSDQRGVFEWQTGSLLCVPLNTWHRLFNGSGAEPAAFLGFTNAPLILDVYHDPAFVFGADYVFGRYDGRADYFTANDHRYTDALEGSYWGPKLWQTNFIPDVRIARLDPRVLKGDEWQTTVCEMGDGVLVAHMAEWPSGLYQKAHHHGAGAVLLIVRGSGYSLLWPQEAGIQPFQSGQEDKLVRVNWREGSVFSPPGEWFHQHFNTGPEPVRQLALRYGTRRYGVEFQDIRKQEGVHLSVREGGTLIEYEDEDPEMRRLFESECTRNGVQVKMKPVAARTSAQARLI